MSATTPRIWVLGAPDPEMAAIERLLLDAGEAVVHATARDGSRISPARAYDATLPAAVDADTIYEVECMITDRALLRAPTCTTIDCHRPGDPGYGRPLDESLAASSLGQVIAELARLGHEFGWSSRAGGLLSSRTGEFRLLTFSAACDPSLSGWYVSGRGGYDDHSPGGARDLYLVPDDLVAAAD